MAKLKPTAETITTVDVEPVGAPLVTPAVTLTVFVSVPQPHLSAIQMIMETRSAGKIFFHISHSIRN